MSLYLFSEDLTDESQFLTSVSHTNVEILSGLKRFLFKIKLCIQNIHNVRLVHFSLEVRTE